MLSNVFLGVIALSTAILAVRSLRPMTKKRHMKARLTANERDLWDMEFQREKLKSLREGIRRQYDRLNESHEMSKKRIEEEKQKGKPDKEAIEHLEKLVEGQAPDLEQMKKQMEQLDNEIDGDTNPQSVQQKIEAHRTLREMLKEFLKTL